MTDSKRLATLADDLEASLWDHLLQPWFPRCLSKSGGFAQEFAGDWSERPSDVRTVVFQSRMTWITAQVSRLDDPRARPFARYADHGYAFLAGHLIDPDTGAVRWGVGLDRPPTGHHFHELHAYGSAFAIYALAAVAQARESQTALDLAQRAFAWVEESYHDGANGGYHEVVSFDGLPILTEPFDGAQDAIGTPYGQKSQNTHLHLLEAYAELHRVWPDPKLKLRIGELLDILLKTLHHDAGWSDGFAHTDWSPVSSSISYGHDIELVHLAYDAATEVGLHTDLDLHRRLQALADYGLECGWDGEKGGYYNRGTVDGVLDPHKVWWVQAEGLLGLATAYKIFREDRYLNALEDQWRWIKSHQIDPNWGGWFEEITPEGEIPLRAKGHAWKAAYHDGRGLLYTAQLLRSLSS